MQATFQAPVTGPSVTGINILHIQVNGATGEVHVMYQEVAADGTPLGRPRSVALGAAAATAITNWFKNNLAGPLGNALGTTVSTVA